MRIEPCSFSRSAELIASARASSRELQTAGSQYALIRTRQYPVTCIFSGHCPSPSEAISAREGCCMDSVIPPNSCSSSKASDEVLHFRHFGLLRSEPLSGCADSVLSSLRGLRRILSGRIPNPKLLPRSAGFFPVASTRIAIWRAASSPNV
jgi:hypothetical protein